MGRSSKTTEFLMECMADALIKLMCNKQFQKITADEITVSAGVGRATWFRNFNSKEDAIRFKLRVTWERYAEEHSLYERSRFDIENASAFFDYNAEMKKVLKTIYSAGLDMLVFDVFKEIMVDPHVDSPEQWFREKFYAYGLYGVLDGWIRRDFAETPEEMCRIVISIYGENTKTLCI